MLDIIRIGENTIHDHTFFVDRPHGHPVYLFILVKTSARFFVENEWKNTPAGIAVIFKPGQRHLYGPAEDSRDASYIDDWMHISSSAPILPEHFPFGHPVLLHNPGDYYTLFHLIHNEFYGAAPHKNTVLDSLTNALLNKLADESNTVEYPALYYHLTALREKIYKNPQADWNIPDMARSLNISEGYLHSVYRHFFHTTCMNDVIKSRIQTACELLISTSKSVEQISESCGYHYTEHFIRQFKKETGVTPAKYRRIT